MASSFPPVYNAKQEIVNETPLELEKQQNSLSKNTTWLLKRGNNEMIMDNQ